MSDMDRTNEEGDNRPAPEAGAPPAADHKATRPRALWLLALAALLPLAAGLAYGAARRDAQSRQVMRTIERQQDFVPTVRVAKARAADSTMIVSLPATTLGIRAANIFARANGYIETRKVDIGDRVKAGDLLAQITAPELDHQISQNEAMLSQSKRRCSRRRPAGTSLG